MTCPKTIMLGAALLVVLSAQGAAWGKNPVYQESQGFAPGTPYAAPQAPVNRSTLDAFLVRADEGAAALVLRGPAAAVAVWPVGVAVPEEGLRLLDPKGQPFRPDGRTEARFQTGFSSELPGLVDLPPTASLLKVMAVTPGRYTLDWSQGRSGAKAYMVAVQDGSPYEMDVQLSRMVYALGERPTLTAKMWDAAAGRALAGMDVTASIKIHGSPVTRVLLHDDGLSPDDLAGDGVYSASLPPAVAGPALTDVKVDGGGLADGLSLHRVGHAAYACASESAAIQEARLCQMRKAKGRVATLSVPVVVHARTAGRYRLQGLLTGRDNQGQEVEVAYASTTAHLSKGAAQMVLAYDGAEVARAGVEPPYTLRDVALLDEGAMTVADERRVLGTVDGFRLADLPAALPAGPAPAKRAVPAE